MCVSSVVDDGADVSFSADRRLHALPTCTCITTGQRGGYVCVTAVTTGIKVYYHRPSGESVVEGAVHRSLV